MLRVLDRGGLGESADAFGQAVRVIGHLRPNRDFGLRDALSVNDRLLVLHLLPLEALFAAVRVEALAVLPRDVVQTPRHLRDDIAVLDLERRRLDREGVVVLRDQLVALPPGAVADDA